MRTKHYKLPLILLVCLLLSPLTCLADGALDLLIPTLLLILIGFILMIGGLVVPVVNLFSKDAGLGQVNLIMSSIILFFALIFTTWDVDFAFLNYFLYVALIGFIVYLQKNSNHTPLRAGILLGLYLLLTRLIFTEFYRLPRFYLIGITILITGLFVFLNCKKQLDSASIIKARINNVGGLKLSLVSGTFYFITYFYYYAADRNLYNWFSFRNDNSSGLLGFEGFLFLFFGTFVTVLVTGAFTSWGTKELYLTKAKAN